MGYSRKTSNYPKRIELSYSTYLMIMFNYVAIGVETLRIDSGCSLEKEFTKLIGVNLSMVLYLTFNQVDSCHGCVCGHFT